MNYQLMFTIIALICAVPTFIIGLAAMCMEFHHRSVNRVALTLFVITLVSAALAGVLS